MKVLRPLVGAALLVAGFVYLTSVAHWDARSILRRSVSRLWTEPAAAAGPGFSSDEQNNIDIYKSSRDATVNITSIVYREGWFF